MIRNYFFGRIIAFLAWSFFSCETRKSPTEPVNSGYKAMARGMWQAKSGDIANRSDPDLIFYNWYSFSPTSDSDSILVTYDNGIACTTTPGRMFWEGRIIFEAVGVTAIFAVESNQEISASFRWNGKTYRKQLKKMRDDPTVLCD